MRPVLRVVVQGTHGCLDHGARGNALPQDLTVLCCLPCEPAGTQGSPHLDAEQGEGSAGGHTGAKGV